MTWPLIERELRTALRKPHLQQTRTWGSLACAALATLFLLAGGSGGTNWGQEFNRLLFWGGLFIILQVPTYTVGIFTEERRNQTLGLLFLCGIRPGDLFLSKSLGAAVVSFSRLLLLYPFLAIAFLGGGLSLDMFIATTISLPVMLLFVFSACVLASVLCREDSTAMLMAGALVLGICLPAPLWQRLTLDSANNGLAHQLLILSPARAPYLAATGMSTGTMNEFWSAICISLAFSTFLLAAAAFTLGRIWQDQPDRLATSGWRTWWVHRVQGNATWRRQLALRWHEQNPFVWLAQKDRWPVTLAWTAFGCVHLCWIVGAIISWEIWLRPAGLFFVVIVMNYLLGSIVQFTAATTIGNHRRTGALELLLTTPFSHLDLIRGQFIALREQFRPVALTMFIMNLHLLVIGLCFRSWQKSDLILYLFIWSLLMIWTGSYAFGSYRNTLTTFWDSLVCGRPAFVVLRRMNLAASPAWWIYIIFLGNQIIDSVLKRNFQSYPIGSLEEWLFLTLIVLMGFVISRSKRVNRQQLEHRLAADFRIIAAVPVPEPSDPRYKEWRSGDMFPDMLTDYLIGRALQQVNEKKTVTNLSQ